VRRLVTQAGYSFGLNRPFAAAIVPLSMYGDTRVKLLRLEINRATHMDEEKFEGSRRPFEVADSIEEIKMTCAFCNRKAITNLKHVDGVATLAGPAVDLGAEEKYFPACCACYKEQHALAQVQRAA
jgi:hypothetical protein